ncbi:MAG: PSD1 and planctomycete cytochrome C domain-containing protein [Verrucomicrobia bacterium]|nr:PSD1 and planctomycete cytochrome C domain-containing protein [Verrucomicrobiota bacterium]
MNIKNLFLFLCIGIAFGDQSSGAEPTSAAEASGSVDFARDIRPIFFERCLKCHGIEKQKGGLRLDDKTAAFQGGDSGRVIQPGKSGDSLLYKFVAGLDPDIVMPPKGERLTMDQIRKVKEWIDAGAPWPNPDSVSTDLQTSLESQHWAFVSPKTVEPPRVADPSGIRNAIDQFILARLDREGISPSLEADRSTLIRRLSLDLRGLPPSLDEIELFANDHEKGAYDRLVSRMLASPHFGEHWGRHWLDLARYADSDGYEKDSARPYAYLYRDWVVNAINCDVPYDQFSTEQLAGDLLPDATDSKLTATGFHRNTLTNREGGVDQEEFRCKATVDRVSTTGTVWLGLTVGCAECHSHKYDPITQREFYQLYAFFNNVAEKDIPLPRPGEWEAYESKQKTWAHEQSTLRKTLDEVRKSGAASTEELDKQLADHAKKEPKYNGAKAQALVENSEPRETHVHIRGDFLRKGDPVTPGTPAVLHPFHALTASPTRLDLSHWLFDPANPLTARVAVNRIWHHLFGRGLVRTMNDFGTRGENPSHPDLLDWLATEFQRIRWSRKELIRLIVSSATYRQSSHFRTDLAGRDPNNTLLARQNRFRLEAETVRDAALTVSGLLKSDLGGPSIRPPLPADIAALGYANSVKWIQSEGSDQYRRGLYIFFQRTVPYPMLVAFDAPDSNATCSRRERSNTPLQALTLLNDPVFFECAQGLGRRISKLNFNERDEQFRLAFALCLARQPSQEEIDRLRDLHSFYISQLQENRTSAAEIIGSPAFTSESLKRSKLQTNKDDAARIETPAPREESDATELAALIGVARAILNLDEFVTRN